MICVSDMHAFLGNDERNPAPLILGHEAAGVVLQGLIEGKRVTFNRLVTSDKCKASLRGQDNICPNLSESADHLDATATMCVRRTCSYF